MRRFRCKRRPAEHRHAHISHARCPRFEDRRDEIDAGQQGADAGDLQRPEVVVDADAGRELQLTQRRIRDPTGLCELADCQRDVRQEDARSSQPERHRIQRRKRHIADAELQRDHEIHQADHERHRHEEDHDRAMRREDLVEMLRRQISLRAAGRDGLLSAHHDRVGETAEQHDQRQQAIHHADPLMVDGCDPLAPQIGPVSLDGDPAEDEQHGDDHQ